MDMEFFLTLSRQLVHAQARVRFQKSQRGLRGGQCGNGKEFPPRSLCPASVITPMIHTQTTFIYHNRY